MKRQKSILLFFLAVVSLIAIGAILASGIIKNKKDNSLKITENPGVLGESTVNGMTSPAEIINNFIEKTIQNTKEKIQENVSQKVTQTKDTVLTNLEKEFSSLTKSQIESMKLQICRDWGVITATPSPAL